MHVGGWGFFLHIGVIQATALTEVLVTPEMQMRVGYCNRPTRSGQPCNFSGSCCSHHARLEVQDMEREDRQSLLREHGACGEIMANGRACDNVRGRCRYHALEEQRCQSCKEDEPYSRCRRAREAGSLFCGFHLPWPNLGLNLKRYAEAKEGAVVDVAGFCAAHYPSATGPPPVDFDRLVAVLLALPAEEPAEEQVHECLTPEGSE